MFDGLRRRARRPLRPAFLIVALAGLSACAVPDIRPFAEQTEILAEAVAFEQASTVSQMEAAVAQARGLGTSRGDSFASSLEASKDGYDVNAKVVNSLLNQAVAYSQSLASLAEKGDDGPEAANTLIGSVKRFGIFPISGFLEPTGIAATVLTEIADAVTLIQVRSSLSESVQAAQPGVDALANGIARIYAPDGKQAELVNLLASTHKSLLPVQFGQDALFAHREAKRRLEALREGLVGRVRDTSCLDEGGCLDADQRADLDNLNNVIESTTEAFNAFSAARDDVDTWQADRGRNAAALVEGVAVWAQEHRRIAEYLQLCDGLAVIEGACPGFSTERFREKLSLIANLQEKLR